MSTQQVASAARPAGWLSRLNMWIEWSDYGPTDWQELRIAQLERDVATLKAQIAAYGRSAHNG